MALEIFRLVGSIFVDTDKADESLKKTDKNAEGFGSKLLDVGKKAGQFAAGVVGAATAAGAAIVAVAENTREYRTEQGKLQTAFEAQNFTAEEARKTYEALNGVLGDSGQAVEAANHLALLCEDEKELQKWTDICTGVYATFGDSLPIEGLTEAVNHTAKLGEVQGPLADALEWMGMSTEDFNAKLAACTTEQERASLIASTMNGLYSESASTYKEMNAEIIAANEAQDKMNNSMASIGAAVEPIITQGKALIAEVLTQIAPYLIQFAQTILPTLVPLLSNLVSSILPLLMSVIQQLLPPIIQVVEMLLPILVELLQILLPPLMEIVMALLPPLIGLLVPILDLLKPIMDLLKPILDLVVAILKPLGSLISNLLTPMITVVSKLISAALKPLTSVFGVLSDLLSGTVSAAFEFIMNYVNTLKNVFSGFIDFFKNVFAGNWKGAWESIKNIFSSIWDGIKNAFKIPINWVIDGINAFIRGINKVKIPDWVPAVGGMGFNIAEIPRLAQGGVLERGEVGLLEGTGAEAVVPLHNNKRWINAVAQDMDNALGGSGGQTVALLQDLRDLMEQLVSAGIYLDTGALVGGLAKPMDKKLGQIQAAKARG